MMRISCPFCGERDELEFSFGGEAHLLRPSLEAENDVWADYLFNKDNPKGVHYEQWVHSFGCGRWFNVARDTVTHEIHAVYQMGESKPDLALPNLSLEEK
jgi:heterotetrameric sarcosine oxidase delta subunit